MLGGNEFHVSISLLRLDKERGWIRYYRQGDYGSSQIYAITDAGLAVIARENQEKGES